MYDCKRHDLQAIKITSKIIKGEKLHIAGYPGCPSVIKYAAPCLRDLSVRKIRKKVYPVFHEFKYRIKSKGVALNNVTKRQSRLTNKC